MNAKTPIVAFLSILLVVVLADSFYVILETERALKLRFGKVLRDADEKPTTFEPGLHFKLPFVEKIISLDARVQTMDGAPNVFTTSDKQFLDVDTYVQWRVKDFSQFYLRTQGRFREAESVLERLVDNGLRDQFGQRTLLEAVAGQREQLMIDIRANVNARVPDYGIEVVDIRVKKVNYTNEVLPNVYNQIISERTATAEERRSKGKKEGNIIKATTDATVKKIKAEADEYARTTRGEGDAEAASIYADTYNKNPEFYAFLRSLDAYEQSFKNKGDVLVINPDSEFFKYLKDAEGTSK
ncbi:protease modulator HflC [Aliikangiella coralliicola]|uniref:Protein HflC n=1 Tax=Aliikangiella coralliicola TaxID=2592383 RepID=A0A545UBW6_9GAMM|nr:protease modulator HflC [Aliikangiella coralliicola]TQV86959.1 protease modulator HflC [Aliikangiella coralliicola]